VIRRAARDSEGIGLLKLVIALVILNFAILALFATAGSGALAPAPADTNACESSTSSCGR
jgi:hypothetical protein